MSERSSLEANTRTKATQALQARQWFAASSQAVQDELLSLPSSWNGFLIHLSNRPEQIGGLTLLRLVRIARGEFLITPVFEVENSLGEQFTYEFVSWRGGACSGAKALVALSGTDGITHLVLLKGEKFATNRRCFSCVGGFSRPGAEMQEELLREVREELQISPEDKISPPVSLGSLEIDSGMTDASIALFFVTVEICPEDLLSRAPTGTPHEVEQDVELIPVEQIDESLHAIDDACYLALLLRAKAKGLV